VVMNCLKSFDDFAVYSIIVEWWVGKDNFVFFEKL
jgi:hypothetical protein